MIIAGFLVMVIPCYVYSPKIANLVMLSVFAAFNGMVMYVIFAIENPFAGPIAIDSKVLENLLAMMGSTAR